MNLETTNKEQLHKKFLRVCKRDGFLKTVSRIIFYPLKKISRIIFERKTFNKPRASVFKDIYTSNYWGNNESVSGSGSTLEYTENTRKNLIDIVNNYNIESIVDLCCGDFNWMSEVIDATNVDYTGIDIVPDLIQKNNDKYANDKTFFKVGDACEDKIAECDLLILRDCLFHFSYSDTNKVLQNLKKTNYKYLLTTTYHHGNPNINQDIQTGDFRFIDLSLQPYNFDILKSLSYISEPSENGMKRSMLLFSKENIPTKTNSI